MTTDKRPKILAAAVAVATGLSASACAATQPNAQQVSASPDPYAEPTTTFVPTLQRRPLFELLSVDGDFIEDESLSAQVARVKPSAVLVGKVVNVELGAAKDIDPIKLPGARVESVYLGVKPSAMYGSLRTGANGLVYVEVFKPTLVTEEWLKLADGYEKEAAFLLTPGRLGTRSLVQGRSLRPSYRASEAQSVFYPDSEGRLTTPMARNLKSRADVAALTASRLGYVAAGKATLSKVQPAG